MSSHTPPRSHHIDDRNQDANITISTPRRARPIQVRVEADPPPPLHKDPSDLRRRRRHDMVETILLRAVWLPPPDRVLIESVYRDHTPVADLARLLGVQARPLRRRVRRIVNRLLTGEFVAIVRRLTPSARRAPQRRARQSAARSDADAAPPSSNPEPLAAGCSTSPFGGAAPPAPVSAETACSASPTPAGELPAAPLPPGTAWCPIRRRVAEECVVNGRSLRDAARALNLTLHTVRRHRDALQTILEIASEERAR